MDKINIYLDKINYYNKYDNDYKIEKYKYKYNLLIGNGNTEDPKFKKKMEEANRKKLLHNNRVNIHIESLKKNIDILKNNLITNKINLTNIILFGVKYSSEIFIFDNMDSFINFKFNDFNFNFNIECYYFIAYNNTNNITNLLKKKKNDIHEYTIYKFDDKLNKVNIDKNEQITINDINIKIENNIIKLNYKL